MSKIEVSYCFMRRDVMLLSGDVFESDGCIITQSQKAIEEGMVEMLIKDDFKAAGITQEEAKLIKSQSEQVIAALDTVDFLPTNEGIKRYYKGIYTGERQEDPEMGEQCTCQESCQNPCHGECGCKACNMAYQDFLSGEWAL